MTTKVHAKSSAAHADKLDLVAHLLFEGEKPSGVAGLDALLGGAVARLEKTGDWKGKARELELLYPADGAKATRVALVGLGKKEKATLEGLRRAVATLVAKAQAIKARTLGIALAGGQLEAALDASDVAVAAAESAVLTTYKFDRLKSTDEEGKNGKKPGEKTGAPDLAVTLFTAKGVHAEVVELAVIVAEAANLTRDIANEPANVGTPTRVAAMAVEHGKKAGLKVTVLDKAQIEKLGMGAFLAVAQGSVEPPTLVVMEHEPKTKKLADTYCLVGKGITFDTGGISIKPADKMWDMKYDKCGGCAVIGAMTAIARAKLPVKVVGLVPLTENMPSGTATRPGDIVKAMSGKTVEIQNTDAEGRLILADALCYSERFEPKTVIDLATLTGACVVALGDIRAGLMGTDEGLLADLKAAGDKTGERVWPLPLDEDYGEHVKSDHADLKNLGKAGQAGAISAGYFLKHFAPKGARWAHMDIAGTAWSSDTTKGYVGKGATGFGVRILLEFFRNEIARGETSGKKKAKAR